MLLKNLINYSSKKTDEVKINGLALDSRKVKKGDLFFAIKGNKINGEKYIKDALSRGAKAIICSNKFQIKKSNNLIIRVKDPKKTLINTCVKFYKKKPKNIIAVTGTNGKSSVANFFHQILLLNKIPVASIGTLGIKINEKTKKTKLTSLDIISLHKNLEKIKKAKIDNVIIEASSHGLKQGRLNGLKLKAGIFTNFSQDHLDYHKTMINYFNSKMILFSKLLKKKNFVITDEDFRYISRLKKISKLKKLKLITINKKNLENLKNKTELIGLFQLKNLCMSILASKLCKIKNKKIYSVLKKIQSVSGRLELVKKFSNNIKVFVDYAHTPDALLTATSTLKKHYNNKLTLIFGCGGERDAKKRIAMAKVASKYCDKIYVTDDNPRNENPKNIRNTIIKNLSHKNYVDVGNRAIAIRSALKEAEHNETILIAGKGHEDYQDYGKKVIKISDKKIVKQLKIKKKKLSQSKMNELYNSRILKKIFKYKNQYKFLGVSINSKEVKRGNIFIAIKGKFKNGHNYLSEAKKNGANYCIVSNEVKKIKNKKIIKVKDTINFLKKLAIAKRKSTNAKIIAVTGSAGKTTTKTLLGNALNSLEKTYFSPRSFNNHYGVPLSLGNLEFDHKFGVFEIGMSKAGEIDSLSKIVRPHVAIITNIAEAHIENFKNIKGIANAKSEIIENIEKNGTLILNRDDKFFNYLKKKAVQKNIKVLTFGFSQKADIYLIKKNKSFIKIKVGTKNFNIKANNFSDLKITNLLCLCAVFKCLKLNFSKIKKLFKFFNSLDGRGKIHKINRYKNTFNLIDESYNSNPYSAKNAIFNLSNIKAKDSKKYLLLGDMLELGVKSEFYHNHLSKYINNTDIDKVFVYGKEILNTYKNTKKIKRGNILQHTSDFDEVFSKIIKKKDYLMIKGSNSTRLNRLSRNLIKGKNVI